MSTRARLITVILAGAGVLAACGSSDDGGAAESSGQDAGAVATPAVTTPPVITPGDLGEGEVTIDGVEIDYVTSTPDGFEPGDAAPVLLALPPGSQDLQLTTRLVAGTYAPEAQRLGWVVVSPAAPDGVRFFDGSEALLPGFVDWIETWVDVEGGAPHVAGVSNGGISSFRYAAEHPDRVRSIVAFPGFARSDTDRAALAELVDVPVRLFVGETDTQWVDAGRETADLLADAGGDVELTIFPGEGHIMTSTADGTLLFALLESFR